MAAMAKKMSKYKKGSKEYRSAMMKMKMLKWKLAHVKRKKVVKKVVKVKKGGKRAKKYAKKEKAKALAVAPGIKDDERGGKATVTIYNQGEEGDD